MPRRQRLILRTFLGMARHESPATAAAMAYFSLFSIFPLLLLIIAISDQYFNLFDIRSTALQTVLGYFPGLRNFIQNNIASVEPSPEIIVSCGVIVVWTTFWLVALLEAALNKAWGVTSSRHFIRSRLLALLMILVGGFFISVSVVLTTALTVMRQRIELHSVPLENGWMGVLWRVAFAFTAFLLTFLAFTYTYKLVPNTHVAPLEALTAGIVASSMWQGASFIFALMLRHMDYAAIYGPVGAVLAFLSWVYTSSYILLFGAHLSAQMHRMHRPS
jgi:membrane protein